MSKSDNDGASSVMVVFIVAFVLGVMLLQMLPGSNTSSTTSPSTSYPNSSSPEHRYVTERFRQEGYSASDSQKAADAVIKFHRAQQNR